MKNIILLLALLSAGINSVCGQAASSTLSSVADSMYVFRFVPEDDMFYIPWNNNGKELDKLHQIVSNHRTDILEGRIPVKVDGYCSSLSTADANLRMATLRSNRVKSELILHSGLTESCFVTRCRTTRYKGVSDVVVITINVPVKSEQAQTITPKPVVKEQTADKEPPVTVQPTPESESVAQQQPVRKEQPATTDVQLSSVSSKPYSFAVRTNLLYDAFLFPTLGLEWRVNNNVGIKLDGSLSWWGGNSDKVQKVWLFNPEVRWYLLRDKRFYVGASANYGEYNVYGYPIGSLLPKDTGYQGTVWGAGVTVGYQLRLLQSLSLDFNLGLGYTRSEYDSFEMIRGTRVYKKQDGSKKLWGPTQAGISLIWTIGGNK